MKPLKALIVDDEAPARRKLARMLLDAGGIEVAAEAADGTAALRALATLRPDLAFLDIEMPGLSGTEVAQAAPPGTQVIFVTAHARFAPRAFELRACDYILKPYDPARLLSVLAHARERLASAPQRPPQRLEVDLGDRTVFVSLDALDWVQAARNYVELHSRSKTWLTRATLESFLDRLDQDRFVRVNRSVIIRKDAVAEIATHSHGDCRVRLLDGTEHVWTRRFRHNREQIVQK